MPYLILLACALLLLNEPIGRWMSKRADAHPKKHAAALWLSQFAIAVYGGYFGAGIGILMLAAMAIFLPEDLQAANGMKNFFAMLINGIASALFPRQRHGDPEHRAPDGLGRDCGRIHRRENGATVVTRILRGAVVAFGVIVAVHLMIKK